MKRLPAESAARMKRLTPTESARVDGHLRQLIPLGYLHREIGQALGFTVYSDGSCSGVSNRARRLGLLSKPPYGQAATEARRKLGLPPLEPIKWRDSEQPKPVAPPPLPLYQRSETLTAVNALTERLAEIHAVNRFAFDASDAIAAGDTAWLDSARTTLALASWALEELSGLLTDDAARKTAKATRRPEFEAIRKAI